MPFFSKLMKYTLTMGGTALVMTPLVAKAGFDWTPPPVQQHIAAPEAAQNGGAVPQNGPLTPELDSVGASPLPVPVGNVDAASLPPQDLTQGNLPVPGMKTLPMKSSEPAPHMQAQAKPAETIQWNHAPVASAPVVHAAPAVTETGPVVEGFGKDIPLALALRDIVPSSYAFAFGSGELAGLKVSWRGGKPWQQVLGDALAPLDLEAALQGNVVMIYARQYSAPVAPSASSYIPPAAPMAAPVPVAVAAPVDAPAVPQVVSKPGMPVVDMTVKRKWEARPGSTLREVLGQWSKDANVDLNWSTAYDYPVSNAFYFEGTYGEAVDSLLSSYGGENPAPKGRLYPNLPDGPSVLMVN